MTNYTDIPDYPSGGIRRFIDLGNSKVLHLMALSDAAGNALAALPIASAKGTLTDRSGTIAVGGTAQSLAPANLNRNYLIIQNPSSATASLWIDFGGTVAVLTSPSIELAPGQAWESNASFIPTGAVSINGQAGAVWTAKEN